MDSTIAPSFEPALQPVQHPMSRVRFNASGDPVTIGLQMVNWLVLMLLMSAFMLAATTLDRSEPAGTTSEISSAATR